MYSSNENALRPTALPVLSKGGCRNECSVKESVQYDCICIPEKSATIYGSNVVSSQTCVCSCIDVQTGANYKASVVPPVSCDGSCYGDQSHTMSMPEEMHEVNVHNLIEGGAFTCDWNCKCKGGCSSECTDATVIEIVLEIGHQFHVMVHVMDIMETSQIQ